MAARSFDDELEQLFDRSLNAVFIAGFDGFLRRVNRGFARLLGYSHEEVLARPFIDNVHPDDVEAVRTALAELAAGNDLVGFECRQVTADGWVRWMEWHVTPRLEERVAVGIGLDVTDRHIALEQVSALRRVATLVAEATQPHDLFALVAAEVARVIDVPAVSIASYESEDTVVFVASFPEEREGSELGARRSLDGTSVVAEIRRSHHPARIDDYSELDGSIAEHMRREGWRSTVGSPIVVAGRLWGAVVVSSPAPEPLPPDTEARLADFTELLGAAIANAESHDALERLAEEQAALRRVATLAAQGVHPNEIFSAVSREVAQLFGTDAAYVGRFDPDGPAIVAMGVADWDPEATVGSRWELDDSMSTAEVFRTGRSARIDGADWSNVTARVAFARRVRTGCAVSSPITVDGRLWGAMTVAAREPLPPDTADRLEKFTALVATAIANAESREALERLAEEQSALRRLATMVVEGVPAEVIFSAVSDEVGRLFAADTAAVVKFEHDPPSIVVVGIGAAIPGIPVGTRSELDDSLASTQVYRTGCSARVDERDWAVVRAPFGEAARRLGLASTVASPITVEGRLWGTITISAKTPFPSGTETRLERFSDLLATAIANAESRSELAASRRRIVAASDEARRRIERDLHDGTQQRLVSLGLAVRASEAAIPEERDDLRSEFSRIATGLTDAVAELQEISRGIHPAILSRGGLAASLRALARRSAVPVRLDITTDARLPEPIEVAAYYVASEAIANSTKHAQASHIDLSLAARNGGLQLSIRDDGVGGADPRRGSGLVGLSDRVQAVGGSIRVESPRGDGTHISAELPYDLESQT